MGNLRGSYDAKPGNSFSPGAASLHSVGVGHGPDRPTYEKLSTGSPISLFLDNFFIFIIFAVDLGPVRMSDDDLAFMFESCLIFRLTDYAQQKDKQARKQFFLSSCSFLHYSVSSLFRTSNITSAGRASHAILRPNKLPSGSLACQQTREM